MKRKKHKKNKQNKQTQAVKEDTLTLKGEVIECLPQTKFRVLLETGQEIIASFAVKPTSSILNSRETINKKGKNTKISVKGRHDPCVGIRAVPIGEAMIACVILDQYMMNKAQCS